MIGTTFVGVEYCGAIGAPTGRLPAVCLAYAGIRMCLPGFDQVRDSIAAAGLSDSREAQLDIGSRSLIQLTCHIEGCTASGLLRTMRNEENEILLSQVTLSNPINRKICVRGNAIPPQNL